MLNICNSRVSIMQIKITGMREINMLKAFCDAAKMRVVTGNG